MELTSAEMNVLSGISFNQEEIKRGELSEADEAMLKEMRAVAEYLKEKYPEYTFEITGCEPKEGTARTYNEWFYRAEGVERDAAFIARAEEKDGAYDISDDFYGQIISEDAVREISKVLIAGGFKVAHINVAFWEYFGKEHGENVTAEKVLRGIVPAGNDIKIFLDGAGMDDDAFEAGVTKIEDGLKKEGIKGDVYVVFLKSAEGDLVKDRLYSDSFAID